MRALSDGLAIHDPSLGSQFRRDAWRAVPALTGLENACDPNVPLEPGGFASAEVNTTAQLVVVTAPGDFEDPALAGNTVLLAVLVDGGALQSSFFAKYAADFSRISISSVLSASWCLSRAFSSRSWRAQSPTWGEDTPRLDASYLSLGPGDREYFSGEPRHAGVSATVAP